MTPLPPKLLLDECVPRKLAASFPEAIEVRTAPDMGWGGLENGELLQCAADHGFTAFITIDRNIQSQQNPAGFQSRLCCWRLSMSALFESSRLFSFLGTVA